LPLELRLVKDDRILFSVPVWDPQGPLEIQPEMDDEDFMELANLYSIAANGRRLRMMSELMRRGEMRFSDMLEFAVNPKLVRDCMEPMLKAGLVVHDNRREPYRPSELGTALAIAMTTGMERLLQALEEEMEESPDE